MSNVTEIKDANEQKPFNQAIIGRLEALLDSAKRGGLTALVVVGQGESGKSLTSVIFDRADEAALPKLLDDLGDVRFRLQAERAIADGWLVDRLRHHAGPKEG